jgi:subtilase family serine protease
MNSDMKKLAAVSIGMLVLLAMALPTMAQSPDLSRIYAHPPIQVTPGPLNPSSPRGILPSEFKAAYGFNHIPNQGQGQTIALVDAFKDPNITSDLAFYANYFHLAPCNFQVVIVGNPIEGQGWDLEESLDVEQACALAPHANIILVEANSNSFDDLLAAVAVASAPPYNATVVSMSWGGGEFSGEQQSDSFFCNVVNGNGLPVTFVASTGDGGHGTEYPSVSPCVVAVGGTTLALQSANPPSNPLALNYGSEAAWSGSSGGIATNEPGVSWQNGIFAGCGTSGGRCVPDIASDANPGTGVPVYDSFSGPGWIEVGGTSVAAPDWASFFTLVNSLRVAGGKTLLSTAVEDLYTIYNSPNYLTNFHDITTGQNGGCGADCMAGTGYDLVTGIGSYQANILYSTLVADTH